MTAKQSKLIAGLGRGESRAAASKAAGYKSSASARHALESPHLRRQIQIQLDDAGLDVPECLAPIKAALAATKRIGVEHFEVTDHPTRLQAAELALKLHGELSPDALVPPVAPRPLVIMIHTSDASVNPRAVVLDALAG